MKYKESILKSKLNAIRLQYLVCMLISLIGFQMHSQVVRVIDNKGTISEVNNNQVTTATTAPTSPLKNDIWIDTTSNTVKVWEGTPLNAWQEMASIRNWISNTNSGTYAIDHLVSYNGAIYKNITGTNTDIAPDLDSTNWEVLKSSILSDADGDTKIQVEESADEDLIRFDLAGTEKFVMRGSTIEPVNNGNSVFIGENAGLNDDLTNNQNIAIGTNALRDNVAAFQNVAIGQNALLVNTGGHNNFALGRNSLLANTVGDVNVGLGGNTLSSNINGEGNLAIGASSLSGNISGDNNVAIGRRALRLNQSGNNNVAIGAEAGDNLISGLRNTIIGDETGWGVTTGSDNTIIGSRVKGLATDLSNNIIFSDGAGNIQLQNDGTRWQSEDELQAGSFDTAWQNNTNGGVYAVNHIAIYNGVFYKNITGTNTDTTPDLDATNWVTSKDGLVSGSGTINYLSKFTAAGVVGNSQVYDNGTNIGIGTITPKVTLDIEGDAASTTVLDGMIPPRLTGDQLRAKTYSTDQTGAMVYITAADSAPTGQTANVDTVGYFYFNGTVWNPMSLNVNTTVCEIFDQVGGQLIDEGIFSDIELATTGIIDTSDYSVTSNSILIKSIGRYEITYRASVFGTLTNNQRTGAEFYLQIGGVESLGTRAYAYSRNSGEAPNIVGHNTVTVSKIIDVTVANTEVKIRGQIYASQTAAIVDLAMVPNGSSLIIKSIN